MRVDGRPFADTKADITAGKIFYPVRVDEFGNYDNTAWGSRVWTGTSSDGNVTSNTCSEWTNSTAGTNGSIGYDDGVADVFTNYGSQGCNASNRLYCFGIDNKNVVKVQPLTGRIAFFTNSAWIPDGGVASADQKCQQEAQQAVLSGTF